MKLSTEMLLLLDCTTPRSQSDVGSRIEHQVKRGIDWRALFEFAIPHGVMPLVAESLLHHASTSIPLEMPAQLHSLLDRNRQRNAQQCLTLMRVMSAFARAEIRALAFKGPTLGALAYDDFRLREFHDLDVWTDTADLKRAGSLLRSMCFQPAAYRHGAPVAFRDDLGDEHTQFLSADGSVVVEFQDVRQATHFHFRPDFDELWLRRRQVDVQQYKFETLNPEDLLLVLAAHGSKHCWRRLNWLIDIAGILGSHPDLDWTSIMARSTQWRCRHRLITALALASRLYGARMSPETEEAVAEHSYARQFVGTYLSNLGRGTRSVGRASQLMNNPVSRSVQEVHYHCKLTDRGVDQLSVFSSEVARRAKWVLMALRER